MRRIAALLRRLSAARLGRLADGGVLVGCRCAGAASPAPRARVVGDAGHAAAIGLAGRSGRDRRSAGRASSRAEAPAMRAPRGHSQPIRRRARRTAAASPPPPQPPDLAALARAARTGASRRRRTRDSLVAGAEPSSSRPPRMSTIAACSRCRSPPQRRLQDRVPIRSASAPRHRRRLAATTRRRRPSCSLGATPATGAARPAASRDTRLLRAATRPEPPRAGCAMRRVTPVLVARVRSGCPARRRRRRRGASHRVASERAHTATVGSPGRARSQRRHAARSPADSAHAPRRSSTRRWPPSPPRETAVRRLAVTA